MQKAEVLPEQPVATPDCLPGDGLAGDSTSKDLKRKTVRGAMIAVTGQGANFVLRTGSMMILARLVSPEHFGLVGMVAALTGFLSLFRDAGLAQATVQRSTINSDQTSALFWINLAVGIGLALLAALVAPIVVWLYGEPRLFWLTVAMGSAFIFNGASAQHRALVQRDMRFGLLLIIELLSLLISIGAAIAMAMAGMGYWSLVMMSIGWPFCSMLGLWMTAKWVPGKPRPAAGVRSMLHYGGMVTLNGIVMYIANNVDKVLVGRFMGAELLGIYGRAYQLINLPSENLNSTISWVMLPALSRVQSNAVQLRSYFLKGYLVFLSVIAPITGACALFADDIIRVMLGPQWTAAVPVFQCLAPTIIASALISPLGCLMQATGRVSRSVRVSLLIAPVVIMGYIIGLPHGIAGVATGFSAAMMALILPVVLWARHGTLITGRDMVRTAALPLLAATLGGGCAWLVGIRLGATPPLTRLVVESVILFAVHAVVLLFVLGQWRLFLDTWKTLRMKPST